jgi:hypothetical protein
MRRLSTPALVLLTPLLAAACSSAASAYDEALTVAADEVARLATAQQVERLAVVDLAAADDRSTSLGHYLADGLSGRLGSRADELDFDLCSRDQIGELLKQLKLENSGLIAPQQAATVGNMCGAEVVVLGRYWLVGRRLEAKFDLLRTESAVQIGSAELNAALTEELRGMDGAERPRTSSPKRKADSDTQLPQTDFCDPFSLTLLDCRFTGDDLLCYLQVTNDATGRRTVELGSGSLLIDNGKDSYEPSRVTLGVESLDLGHGDESLAYEITANTTLNAQLDFHTIGRREKKAQILVVDLGRCKAEFRDFLFSRD